MAGRRGKQIAALCWRRRKGMVEVLLITSRETKRWVVPKGWPMDHLVDFNAARQEAFEEAGVEGRVTREPLGRFDYDKRKGNESWPVEVTVYSLEVETLLKTWPEKKQRKRDRYSSQTVADLRTFY